MKQNTSFWNLLALVTGLAVVPRTVALTPKHADAGQPAPFSASGPLGWRLPLYFIENRSQADRRVACYVQGRDKAVYFTSEGVTLALSPVAAGLLPAVEPGFQPGGIGPAMPWASASIPNPAPGGRMPPFTSSRMPDATAEVARWIVKLDFVGANSRVVPTGREPTPAVVSYFRGRRDQWQTGLATFSKVVRRLRRNAGRHERGANQRHESREPRLRPLRLQPLRRIRQRAGRQPVADAPRRAAQLRRSERHEQRARAFLSRANPINLSASTAPSPLASNTTRPEPVKLLDKLITNRN